MKQRTAIVGITAVLLGASISSCGGHGSGVTTTPPSPPTGQNLTTAQVLTLAKQPSESTEPFAVDAGALTLTDTSDTSEALTVNGP